MSMDAKFLAEVDKAMLNVVTEERKAQTHVTVRYTALNGMVFVREHILYYEVQEAMMSLSREAYDNDTALHHITIY